MPFKDGIKRRMKIIKRCPWCLREFHPWARKQTYCDHYCRSQHSVGKRGRAFWKRFQQRGQQAQGKAA